MTKATPEQLATIHGLVTQDITRRLESADSEVRAAAVKAAMDWCKHNDVKVSRTSANPDWQQMASAMMQQSQQEEVYQ